MMKTFEQSLKSQKTVKCMIETRGEKPKEKGKNKKNKGPKKEGEWGWGGPRGETRTAPELRVLACAFPNPALTSPGASLRQGLKLLQPLGRRRQVRSSPLQLGTGRS